MNCGSQFLTRISSVTSFNAMQDCFKKHKILIKLNFFIRCQLGLAGGYLQCVSYYSYCNENHPQARQSQQTSQRLLNMLNSFCTMNVSIRVVAVYFCVNQTLGAQLYDFELHCLISKLGLLAQQSQSLKALAHYKDFHNDFSKKIVVKIVAHI